MLENIASAERKVFLIINGKPFQVSFKKYLDLLDDCYSNLHLAKTLLRKYKIDFQPKKEITTYDYWIADFFKFNTFDKGEIKVELHKFGGVDYKFKYHFIKKSKQAQKIKQQFETSWANDELGVLLF